VNYVKLRQRWLTPLIFFQLYLSLTLVLLFYGPWPWDIERPARLATYLLVAQLFIAVGYLLSWRGVRRAFRSYSISAVHLKKGLRALKIAVFVSMVLLIPTSLSRTGTMIPNIVMGLQDVGAAYNQNFERLESGNPYVVVEYIRLLASPFLIGVLPLTVVYWSLMSRVMKALCLFVIAFNLSMFIATGTNKGIADLVVTLPWMIFLGLSVGVLRLHIGRKTLASMCAIAFAGFLYFFGMGQAQRAGGVGEFGVFNTGFGLIEADSAIAASQFLSDNQRIIFESLSRYLTQGYYALSLSFDIESSSTLGVGNSMFLARNADTLFGTQFFTASSLPGILEEETGWGMFTLWHSIYPWLASDFGFGGALVVLGCAAYLFGASWGRSLVSLSPKWIVLTYLLLIMFFYIPANNQVFQTGETCFAFYIVAIGLLLARARATRREEPCDVPPHASRCYQGVPNS
jgi:hypothetical protein